MNFFPIRIGTLRPGAAVNFDVYILVAEKHIYYIKKTDPIEGTRLEKLKEKGVKKLFIKSEEEQLYLDYLEGGLNHLKDTKVSVQDRSTVAHDSLVTEAENVEKNLETEQGYKRTEVRVGKVVDFLTSDKGAIRGILGAAGCSIDNFQHSASVSSLSLALGMRVGVTDPQELLDIALAGLLHDIGKTKLGIGPGTPREEFTLEQLKDYHRHPEAAVEMLAGKKFISPRVLRLISDHEEIGKGDGFPEKKLLSKLPLNSQILNLCNEFDRLSATLKISHLTLYPKFQAEKIGLFDLEHMKHLNELIQAK